MKTILPFLGIISIHAITPPIFGPVMTAPFFQNITIYGFSFTNNVDFYYDSTTKPVGSSLYNHSKGQHDELCTSIAGKEFSDEPCQLLASSDTWRYVIFPTSNPPTCCRYCNTTNYCGIISPNWLQQNSTYQGEEIIDGRTCYGWEKTGGEENYFWATSDTPQQPCSYYEGYPTFQVGMNLWNFTMDKYSSSPIPGSVFTVPSNMGCDTICKTTELTYEERLYGYFIEGKRSSSS